MLNYFGTIPVDKPPVDLLKLSKWFKVFSEPKRLLIFDLLMQGVQCNCELGETLDMAPNLISHHLGILRKAGLVEVERDAIDSRWIYYSINEKALQTLYRAFGDFFDPQRIKPRRPTCGPQGSLISMAEIQVS